MNFVMWDWSAAYGNFFEIAIQSVSLYSVLWQSTFGEGKSYATRLKRSIGPATAEVENEATSANERKRSDRMLKRR